MDLGLLNWVVFITGASSGIGAATARIFAEEGADVIISYHWDKSGAERAAETVRLAGRQAWLCPMDVRSPASISEAAAQLPEHFSRLDALGFVPREKCGDATRKDWRTRVE